MSIQEALPAIGNQFINPRAASANTGFYWNNTAGGGTLATRLTTDGFRSTTCVEQSGAPDTIEGISKLSIACGGSNATAGAMNRAPVTPLQPVFSRASFKVVAGGTISSVKQRVRLVHRYFDASFAQVGVTTVGRLFANEWAVGNWQELVGWELAVSGAAYVQCEVWCISDINPTTLRVTDVQIVVGGTGLQDYVGWETPGALQVAGNGGNVTTNPTTTRRTPKARAGVVLGVNDDSFAVRSPARNFDSQASQAQRLGLPLIRTAMPLLTDTAFISSGNLNSLTWSIYDPLFLACRAHGVKVHAIFAYCPTSWRVTSGDNHSPPTSGHYTDYAELAKAFLARYGDLIFSVELWNEPNGGTVFAHASYVACLQTFAQTVKDAYPNVTVVMGGLNLSTGLGANLYTTYLTNCYADGIKGYSDAINLHVYPVNPSSDTTVVGAEGTMLQLNNVRAILTTNTDTTPIWLTETGYSSTLDLPSPYVVRMNRDNQATAWQFHWDYLLTQPDVGGIFAHELVSQTPNPPDSGYNLFDNQTFAMLPAAKAIADKAMSVVTVHASAVR